MVASKCAFVAPALAAMARHWAISGVWARTMCQLVSRPVAEYPTSFMKVRWSCPESVCKSSRKSVQYTSTSATATMLGEYGSTAFAVDLADHRARLLPGVEQAVALSASS